MKPAVKSAERKRTTVYRDLRRLAVTIKDREHLEEIVSKAAPDMRSGVRGLLSQYVRFPIDDALGEPLDNEESAE